MIYCINKSSTTHTNTKGQLGFQKKKKKPKGFKGSPLHLSVDRTTFLRKIAYATKENGAWDILLNAYKGVEKV